MSSNRILYVTFDELEEDVVNNIFNEKIAEIAKYFATTVEHKDEASDVIVNYVRDREGKSFNLCYVFISNLKYYNVILGLNPDGSKRVEYIDEESEEDNFGWTDFSGNWGDSVGPKSTKVELDPLVPMIDCMSMDKVFLKELPEHFNPNTLVSCGIPKWLTASDIKEKFNIYATSYLSPRSKTKDTPTCAKSTWPTVEISRGNAYVSFPQNTNDAQYALMMNRKVVFDSHNAVVFFKHATIRHGKGEQPQPSRGHNAHEKYQART